MSAHPPLRGLSLVLGTLAVSSATFMSILDGSIASVSIPAIAGDLGVSPSQATWVITAFGVSNAISVPLAGWMTRRFGQIRLMIGLMMMFITCSLLCGFAPSLEWLISMRVLQGAVTGPLLPLAQTVLLSSYPPAKAGVALSMSSITVLVAPVVGPMLGGWLTDHLSWSWIFFINVPIGLIASLVIFTIYRRREVPSGPVRFDLVGLVLLATWVGAVQMMIALGRDLDWFEAWEIRALAAIAVAGLALFLAWELTERHPIVDLRLFAERNFRNGVIVLSIGFGLFFGNAILMPLWLQQHMGYTPIWAGLALAPVGVFALVMTPWVGRNVARFDPRVLTSVAIVAYAAVFWLRAQFTVQTDIATIIIPTMVQGIAMSFFFIPLQTVIFDGIGLDRRASVAGLSNFVRLSAGAIGATVSLTLWQSRAAMHHARLVEEITSLSPSWLKTQDTLQTAGMGRDQQLGMINAIIDQQAFTIAATEIFHVSSIGFLLLGLLVWRTTAVAARSAPPVAQARAVET